MMAFPKACAFNKMLYVRVCVRACVCVASKEASTTQHF